MSEVRISLWKGSIHDGDGLRAIDYNSVRHNGRITQFRHSTTYLNNQAHSYARIRTYMRMAVSYNSTVECKLHMLHVATPELHLRRHVLSLSAPIIRLHKVESGSLGVGNLFNSQ